MLDPKKPKRFSWTEEQISEGGLGACIACGEESEDYCEPDMRNHKCSACGELQVFGAEELLIMGLVDLDGEYK